MTTSVSIIIPNFNGAAYLVTCLDAVKQQTYPQFETIVVDDGSTDDSIRLLSEEYPWVKLIALATDGAPRSPKRGVKGFIGSINAGIAVASGDIIVLLNNDTEVTPDWARALVQALEQYPQAGIAASKMRLFDRRSVLHSAGDAFGQNGIPINRGVWQEDTGQFDQDILIFGGCGGAVAYRKTMLDDIGRFDDDLFMYCEDVDLNWRAQLAGYQCVFVPRALVYHHLSATGGGELASYYTGRNTILVLIKTVPGIVWRNHFPKIIKSQLRITWDALRAWRGEAARARLKGQLAALLQVPFWLRKRRQVQNTKRVSDEYLESILQDIR